MIFPDEVQILPVTFDTTYGTETEGTAFTSKAYVELAARLVYGSNGAPGVYEGLFLLPATTAISRGHRIKLTKKDGRAVTHDYVDVKEVTLAPARNHLSVRTEGGR